MAQGATVQELATRLSTTTGVILKMARGLGLDLRGGESIVPAERVTEVIRKTAEHVAGLREGGR